MKLFHRIATNTLVLVAFAHLCLSPSLLQAVPPFGPDDARIQLVVMDPLAGPLACDCVQGYAQRRYEELAKAIEQETKLTVRVVWTESLEATVHQEPNRRIDLIIGKDSVVRTQGAICQLDLVPLASLTDGKGETHQTGLFVVPARSNVATLLDLEGLEVLFGPREADEKYAAPQSTLSQIDVKFREGAICESCSVAAKKLLASTDPNQQAAVISSYAAPLLEGCGSIKKGDLRVIGETDPVPFITLFANQRSDQGDVETIRDFLLNTKKMPQLLAALESRDGFIAYQNSDHETNVPDPTLKKKRKD